MNLEVTGFVLNYIICGFCFSIYIFLCSYICGIVFDFMK
jgi:hypothetical protein